MDKEIPQSPASPVPDEQPTTTSVSGGKFGESWIQLCQEHLIESHQRLMTRLIWYHHGLYPLHRDEITLYDRATMAFCKARAGVRQRLALIAHLEKNLTEEGLDTLRQLNICLTDIIRDFSHKLAAFDRAVTNKTVPPNYEVALFLDDLKAYTNAFRSAAQYEIVENSTRRGLLDLEVPEDEAEVETAATGHD